MNKQPSLPTERLRLHYLDGLRGLAALYVVLHHAVLEVAAVAGWLSAGWIKGLRWAWHVHLAVELFIVLSGYCLMMPVARSGGLKGGQIGFIKRRARRILPPYYAALLVTLGITFLVPGMNVPHQLRWDLTLPATTPGVLISHLFLVQDFKAEWIGKVSYPMWTIAQEWQIYFIFAFLLLPVWRRAGIVTAVLLSYVIALALHGFPGHNMAFAAPEFLFLFSAGMLAACINFAEPSSWLETLRDRAPWAFLTVCGAVLYLVATSRHADPAKGRDLVIDAPPIAATMMCLLVSCTNAVRLGRRSNWLLRFFELEAVVALGAFSYSLYLIHAPILAIFTLVMHSRQTSGPTALGIELFIAVPVAIGVAYGFHLVAERPFMLGHPKNLKRAEQAAVLDTAP